MLAKFMFKLFTSSFLICLSVLSHAQLQGISKRLINDLPVYSAYHPDLKLKSAQTPKSCDEDTLEYARYKGTAFTGIGVFNGYSLGQYFDAPDTVEITGTTFYAWGLSSGNDTVELIVKLYKAGTDTLPTGSAIRSAKIKIDTTFGGGVLTAIRRNVVFDTSFKTNEPFIITIESNDSIRVAVVTNSYTAKDGDKENLSCGTVSSNWYNCLNLNINGTPLDCDILIEPHVKYKTFADFSVNDCFRISDSILFTNKSSPILGHRMYNRYMSYGLGQYSYYWYFGAGAGSMYDPKPKYKYTFNTNYQVRLVTTMYGYRSPIGCRDTAYFDLHYQPTEISYLADTPICSGNAAKITAFSTGTISWFNKSTDTTAFLTGSTHTTPVLDSTVSFVLQAKNFDCATTKKNVIIPVAKTPETPTITNDSVCLNAKANLTATTNVGDIIWWTDSIKGTALDTGNVYITSNLSNSQIFYAEAQNQGCISEKRVAAIANVSASNAPKEPLTTIDSLICLYDGITNLTAVSPDGDDLRWFTTPTGGNAAATGNSYSYSPTTLGNKFVYVEAFDGQCASSRIQKRITVWTFPSHTFAANDTLCLGDTLHLDFSYTYGAVKWFDDETDGNMIYDGNKFDISGLTTANTFYLEPYSNACKDTARHAFAIEVLPFGVLSNIKGASICANTPATLSANTDAGIIIWAQDPELNTILASGNSYETTILSTNTTYYVASKNFSCVSNPQEVLVSVKPAPSADFNYQVNSTGNFTFVASTAGLVYNWDFGDGNTGIGRSVTHKYKENGNFVVELSSTNGQGCSAKSNRNVKVAGLLGRVEGISEQDKVAIWPNPSSGALFIELSEPAGKVAIYTLKGQQIYETPLIAGVNEINLTDLNSLNGIYIIRVSTQNAINNYRLLFNR